MKKNIISAAILTATVVGFSSCSKCYDCSYVTEVDAGNGIIEKDTITDEFCTASSEEIKEKENQGYTCVDQ